MLSIIAAVVLAQASPSQICVSDAAGLTVHVVLKDVLYHVHCPPDSECSGATIQLTNGKADPNSISGMWAVTRGKSNAKGVEVLQHGLNRFEVEIKTGRVTRISGSDRSEAKCSTSRSAT